MATEKPSERQDAAVSAAFGPAELSAGISQHLRVAVAAAEFSSGSTSSSGGDDDSSSDEATTRSTTTSTMPSETLQRQRPGSPPEPTLAAGDGEKRSGGGSATQQEFIAEPEWQRAPGRWSKFEEGLLREMKAELQQDLRAVPPFPEVVGLRRMLRFLRGHRHDAKKAAAMMRQMLQWRKDNGVDAIREDIMKNCLFDPSQFPEGEMITKLFPLLVVNPHCVDMDGAPISYESYDFSPRQVTAHANGDLGFFIKFHIYCQEFKQICLDSLSDAKEMENLARRAIERASPPTATGKARLPGGDGSFDDGAGGRGPSSSSSGGGGRKTLQDARPQQGTGGQRRGVVSGGRREAAAGNTGGTTVAGDGRLRSPGVDSGQKEGAGARAEGEEEGDDEEEPWGVVLRNTIIRDLAGFGMEHAGPIGRSLISKVLSVSQDNYPEMMEKCYIINAPWVFYALWKGLTPLVSASTAKKVQVLKYDFLPALCETIAMERLPRTAGGGCDPTMATAEQMYDLVVCGRVAELPGAGGGEESEAEEEEEEGGVLGPGGNSRARVSGEGTVAAGMERPEERQRGDERGAGLASSGSGGGGGGGRRNRREGRRGNDGGGGGGGGGSGGKPHVTFRSLFERLQARDDPRDVAAAAAAAERSRQMPPPPPPPPPPLFSRAASFQSSQDSLASPPLSRHGSNASMSSDLGGSSRRHDPRLSPGRPFASPGPRGIRRGSRRGNGVAGVGARVRGEGDGVRGHFGTVGGGEDDQAEDFDSRLVGRALKMSMRRKAQRFRTSEGAGGGTQTPVEGMSSGLFSPPNTRRIFEEQDGEEKGGWARKKWRALRERRESRKLLERGFLSDLPGLTAGDCAEWIPNSARNSCLHCERPFTILLRRHHCRMCGEVVCGQCSPHRVRLAGDSKEAVVAGGGSVSDDGAQEASHDQSGRRRRRRHDRGSKLSAQARKERENGSPRAVAVRVCTDCHFSLQTVTVATSLQAKSRRRGATNGGHRSRGGGDVFDDDEEEEEDDESLLRRLGNGGYGRGDVRARGSSRRAADDDVDGAPGVDGWGFVERLEAVYAAQDISGDLTLEDVLKWDRIERRASKSLEVVRICLVAVVEMHHHKLLEGILRVWRASIGALSMAAKQAVAALSSRTTYSSSSSSPSDLSLGGGGGEGRRGQSGGGGGGGGGGGASTTVVAAGSGAAARDACGRSPAMAVAAAEAVLWAAVDQGASCHYSAWLLVIALLPIMFRLW